MNYIMLTNYNKWLIFIYKETKNQWYISFPADAEQFLSDLPCEGST